MAPRLRFLGGALAACAAAALLPADAGARQQAPRTILYDVAPRAVEYQLARLTNHELTSLERNPGDPRYRPVYVALLTRKGLGREYMDEAIDALTTIDRKSRVQVLLDGLEKVPPADGEAAERLLRVLFAQPPDGLRADRAALAAAAGQTAAPHVLRGAYGGLMLADASPDAAWQMAAGREGHLPELLHAVPYMPASPVRATLAGRIGTVLDANPPPPLRAAALTALAAARPDAATFQLLARAVIDSPDQEVRQAAVRALRTLPDAAWPSADVEPLARALVAQVKSTPVEARTAAATMEALQLGERAAQRLSGEPRRAVLRDLRGAGVQVVRIDTVPEQMAFDLRWFVVEAGKRVQIVLTNPDAMPHNLLIGKPGSLQEIGTAASTMPLPSDPSVKPYVPDLPSVLQATRLLNWGETERLTFMAPKEPGDYVFVCTFPGHWVRMYGVMLVVNDIEAWEANRRVPLDPMTQKPFPSQRFSN